ncbi:MAG: hypothetical protein ACXV7D_05070 [Thermoanaerobaculia bacterium]
MRNDKRRITVVARGQATPDRFWDTSAKAPNRLLFLEAMPVLQHVLDTGVPEMNLDIERVLLDRAASAVEYLDLLATLPMEFGGDVVYIREDESGFLSANGRGGNRVMYALTSEDIRFYLETHALVSASAAENAMPIMRAMTG